MESTIIVEVLSKVSNSLIIQIPDRKFPGVIIQGDSLKVVYDLAEEIYELCQDVEIEELKELTVELKELLAAYLLHYETTLKTRGIELPYTESVEGLI